MELNFEGIPELKQVVDGSEANLLYEALLSQRQEAETKGDFDAYACAEEKLQQLEEFEAQRLDRQARMLEAQVRIQSAQRQLIQEKPENMKPPT